MSRELLESTGDPKCDRVVEGLIGVFEVILPGRLRACYLRGSRASNMSVDGSDLDLYLVVKDVFSDVAEYERASQLVEHCARISPVLLEVLLIGERRLHDSDAVEAAQDIRIGTRLLFGDDIRSVLDPLDVDAYVRSVVHTPYYSYSYPEQRQVRLEVPLDHLDPAGEFYGFDQWLIPDPTGADVPSTKLLVATVGWTATAIVALRAGVYVRDKSASVQLYQQHVGDEWEGLVTSVYDLCRTAWRYFMPSTDSDRRELRNLSEQALHFQNHYLEQFYLDYQLDELDSNDIDRQSLAALRLGQIIFPIDRVIRALRALESRSSGQLCELLTTTLRAYA